MMTTAPYTYRFIVGDTLAGFAVTLRDSDSALELTPYTVKLTIEQDGGTPIVEETETGITKQQSRAFTADAERDLLLCPNNKLDPNTEVVLATTGTLPAPLESAKTYFVTDPSPHAIALTDLPDDAPLDLTSAGTGSHSLYAVGEVNVAVPAAVANAEGTYRAWLKLFKDGKGITWPNDATGVVLEVAPRGAAP